MKIFEFFGGTQEEQIVTDGARHVAVPDRGQEPVEDASDPDKESTRNEIAMIEGKIKKFDETGDDGGNDINFLRERLVNLKTSLKVE